jgi:serpin B
MKRALRAMGMVRAFNAPGLPDGAEFDGMCEGPDPALKLFLSAVLHKAFVEVNEKGTEAAAATVAVSPAEPAEVMVPFTPAFRADHPFLFLIRDRATGCILFLGRVADPTAG